MWLKAAKKCVKSRLREKLLARDTAVRGKSILLIGSVLQNNVRCRAAQVFVQWIGSSIIKPINRHSLIVEIRGIDRTIKKGPEVHIYTLKGSGIENACYFG